MAITQIFGGATLYVPGCYTVRNVILTGGAPSVAVGKVAIIGEASNGAPGSAGIMQFAPEALSVLIQMYGSGPIVDAARMLVAPSNDSRITSGASAIYVYKTNPSTQGTLTLLGGTGNWGTITSQDFGQTANLVSVEVDKQNAIDAVANSSAPVNLTGGSPLGFAILAGSAITNTGASMINGNVGVAPGTAITAGGWTLTGTSHSNDGTAVAAQAAAYTLFTQMQTLGLAGTSIPAILDGQTLTPGNYHTGAASLAASGAGTLTLNGAGTYIIYTSSTLVTGAGGLPTISLTGGATAANVYFIVGSSATINSGTAGTFNGNIVANTSISISTGGGVVNGDMVALSGAVTIAGATTVNGQSVTVGGSFAEGDTFTMRVEGGVVNTFTMPASVSSQVSLLAALNNSSNWSPALPSGLSFTTSGTDATAIVSIALAPLSTDETLGYGRTFELVSGSPDLLAALNMTPGLYVAQEQEAIRLLVQRALTNQTEDTNNSGGDIGGTIYMEVGYQGVSATMSIGINTLTTTVVGGSGHSLTLTLANFTTINDLAAYINAQPGYTANVPSGVNGGLNPNILDKVTIMGIASTGAGLTPGEVKADYYTVYAYVLANSSLITVANSSTGLGLPEATSTTFLSGAIAGASASSNFTAGLSALESIDDVDIIVPLVSQDATNDITENPSYTDPGSTYTVSSILAATNAHCNLMSNTANRKERVCYLGFRGTLPACETQALSLNSAFCSMLIQDVEVVNVQGNLQFMQPHIAASLAAGMQAGANIGQPTTKKDIQATAIRHVGQAGVKLSPANLFDPKTDLNIAIANGIFPLNNPSTGGIQIVVQNSTYSIDSNFVYNRPSVFSAMNYISKVVRQQLESMFVGTQNLGVKTQKSMEAEMMSIMADFLRSNIIVGDDSNNGLGWKSLSVRISGDAVFMDITVTPVQGIDFILVNLNFDNIRVSATS